MLSRPMGLARRLAETTSIRTERCSIPTPPPSPTCLPIRMAAARSPTSASTGPTTHRSAIPGASRSSTRRMSGAFDPEAVEGRNPLSGERLRDYWGYNPVAPVRSDAGQCRRCRAGRRARRLQDHGPELHRAGIEVILDVVFNHTAEGGRAGPTYSSRGLDNPIDDMLTPDGEYADYTGCGNTRNCNHPGRPGRFRDQGADRRRDCAPPAPAYGRNTL